MATANVPADAVHGARFPTFSECYEATLRHVFTRPEHFVRTRGTHCREVLGASFTIECPWNRFLVSPARRTNIVFSYAETLWYLGGRDDSAYLTYYAPGMVRFTGGRTRLVGTAYGPRIFGIPASGRPSQWERVVAALREDPQSRRAVVQIFSESEKLNASNTDCSCTLALQFVLRDGVLDVVTYMRANDAYRGMVSDVFSFTLLQEIMAAELGVRIGCYHHHVGSLHIYSHDFANVERFLESLPNRKQDEFPTIPAGGDVRGEIGLVIELEHQLRGDRLRLDNPGVYRLGLSAYWSNVVRLLECYRRVTREEQQDEDIVAELPAVFRQALSHRWPDSFPQVVSVEEGPT